MCISIFGICEAENKNEHTKLQKRIDKFDRSFPTASYHLRELETQNMFLQTFVEFSKPLNFYLN
jgi:hypothetical protein